MQDADKDDAIIVAITRDGKIYLGNTQMPRKISPVRSRIASPLVLTRPFT